MFIFVKYNQNYSIELIKIKSSLIINKMQKKCHIYVLQGNVTKHVLMKDTFCFLSFSFQG